MFILGNIIVKPGQLVWTDLYEAIFTAVGIKPTVVLKTISGRILDDGKVRLSNGTIVPLDTCRVCEKVIRC